MAPSWGYNMDDHFADWPIGRERDVAKLPCF